MIEPLLALWLLVGGQGHSLVPLDRLEPLALQYRAEESLLLEAERYLELLDDCVVLDDEWEQLMLQGIPLKKVLRSWKVADRCWTRLQKTKAPDGRLSDFFTGRRLWSVAQGQSLLALQATLAAESEHRCEALAQGRASSLDAATALEKVLSSLSEEEARDWLEPMVGKVRSSAEGVQKQQEVFCGLDSKAPAEE